MIQKKTFHFTLPRDLHAKFRVSAFENDVTMQEIFRALVERYLENESTMRSIIKRVRQSRETAIPKGMEARLGNIDTETIYDLIEETTATSEDF